MTHNILPESARANFIGQTSADNNNSCSHEPFPLNLLNKGKIRVDYSYFVCEPIEQSKEKEKVDEENDSNTTNADATVNLTMQKIYNAQKNTPKPVDAFTEIFGSTITSTSMTTTTTTTTTTT